MFNKIYRLLLILQGKIKVYWKLTKDSLSLFPVYALKGKVFVSIINFKVEMVLLVKEEVCVNAANTDNLVTKI